MRLVKTLPVFVIAIILMLAFTLTSYSAIQDFSADLVYGDKDRALEAKVYIGFCKIRVQTEKIIYIERTDVSPDIAWMIVPETKTYAEMPLFYAFPWNIYLAAAWPYGEKLPMLKENDVLRGRPATKYIIKADNTSIELGHAWLDPSSQAVLKVDYINKDSASGIEFNNIKAGMQDLKLFEVPLGYTKVPFDEKAYIDIFKNAFGKRRFGERL